VLTIGATNLAQELDQALLRPGRFEVVYEIPSPGPQARLEILKYHSKNKPVADPNMFFKVAEATAGWSAAALANLMNEAAILTVREHFSCSCRPLASYICVKMNLNMLEHAGTCWNMLEQYKERRDY
jgi:SpoVK/Ycf46/Vps4 family AAA+-type ATPase